ncbi:unnamed protein product [Ilex paraguariensis]|uniref:Serine-threonine/tyrosine-protein kinase catalytic domain-containing protein n=1 Tax=Ilex paraguariensis TaxID=185542 RepID=A0ABC8SAH3_9AQUA
MAATSSYMASTKFSMLDWTRTKREPIRKRTVFPISAQQTEVQEEITVKENQGQEENKQQQTMKPPRPVEPQLNVKSKNMSREYGGQYLAPEYFMYGKVNDKIDVYAYGVVLLELLSGRKPICSDYPKGQESLVMWAKPIVNSGKFTQLLDPTLDSNYDREQMERMVLAATLCIRRAPRARPQMSLVLKLLQGDVEVTNWARLQVNASEGSDAMLQANALEGSDAVDDEAFSRSNLQSHLNLALLDVEEVLSISSIEQSISLEDYLQGRWSRSSSFD